MRKLRRIAVWTGLVAVTVGRVAGAVAEEKFSAAIPAAEFSAAGLTKLTPQELARLDALVRDFKRGEVATARREPAVAAEARAAANGKVKLAPGTEVEYSTVESRMAGVFRGWERRMTFTLENGQRWQVIDENSYVTPGITNPAVKIVPGLLGSFWMTVEGVKPRVKVAPVGAK